MTFEGRMHWLPNPFLVIATQNPYEQMGIFPLPESQLDRFLFKIELGYGSAAEEEAILSLPHHGLTPDLLGELQPLLDVAGLSAAQRELDATAVAPEVVRECVRVVRATREADGVTLGASPRAAVHLLTAAKAHARISGRPLAEVADVHRMAVPVLSHRLLVEEGDPRGDRPRELRHRVSSPASSAAQRPPSRWRRWWQPENRPRRIRVWILGIVVALGLNYWLVQRATEAPLRIRVPYSPFFLGQVRGGNVEEITSRGTAIQGTFRKPRSYAGSREATRFSTEVPSFANGDALTALLQRERVVVNAEPLEAGLVWWKSLLFSFGPALLLVGLLIWFLRRTRGASGMLGSFGRSKARRYEPSAQSASFADVAGIDEAKAELSEVVDFLRNPERYHRLGGRIPRGVLLSGPPGTGKTLLARAVAGEAGAPFFSMSASEFVEAIAGIGASRVRDLFARAKEEAPAIVFVDELDAIGRSRTAHVGFGGGGDEREQTLNQILTEMDGFDSSTDVIVIAATNRPDILDAALLRPGRFDRRVAVQPPDKAGREKILEVHTRSVPLADDVDLGAIAASTPGMVGADLANVANEAALLAARRSHEAVTRADFGDALERIVLGAERQLMMRPEDRMRTAYHEAGHALVAMLTEGADPVRKISIIPRSRSLGVTHAAPDTDRFNYSERELLASIAFALGGRAAEELVFGDLTTGAENDIHQISGIARLMVGRWGMSRDRRDGRGLPGRAGARPDARALRRLGADEGARRRGDAPDRRRRLRRRDRVAAGEPHAARRAGRGAARAGDARRARGLCRRRPAAATDARDVLVASRLPGRRSRPTLDHRPYRAAASLHYRSARTMAISSLRMRRDGAQPPLGTGLRLVAGTLILAFAAVLEVGGLRQGQVSPAPFILAIGAIALVLGRFGRAVYYLLPTVLAFVGYVAARQYVTQYKLAVHYLPQLRADELLGGGTLPTVWLQEHLYHGRTGPLEIFSMLVYVSHFIVPLLFGGALILTGKGRSFVLLMFGILVAVLLSEIVFVLAPTAPPWLAAQDGYVTGVRHVLKQTFADVHLTRIAEMSGDPTKYDVTAAVPSLHAAYPVICLLAARHARLPRVVVGAFWLNILAVVFAIVYLGEHYVVDAVAGVACALVSWYAVSRLDRRHEWSAEHSQATGAGTERAPS